MMFSLDQICYHFNLEGNLMVSDGLQNSHNRALKFFSGRCSCSITNSQILKDQEIFCPDYSIYSVSLCLSLTQLHSPNCLNPGDKNTLTDPIFFT